MGEQFKSRHTEQFRHQQDAAHEKELKRRHLFSERSEVFTLDYRCRPLDRVERLDCQIPLYARCHADGAIEISQGGRMVGCVEGGAETLREAFRSDPRACGVMRMELRSQSPLTGYFVIGCAERNRAEG